MSDDRTQQSSFTSEIPTVPPQHRPRSTSRRKVATMAVALLLLGAGGGALLAATGGGDPASSPAAAAPVAPADGSTVAATVAPPSTDTGASSDAAPSSDEQASDEPTPTPPPAAPGHLVVSTSHLNLGVNGFAGSFEVRNDGESPIDWAWNANHPAVSAAPSGGTLDPGEAIVVEVTVHWQQLGNGGYNFPTHVTGGDQQLNVLVSGTKNVVVNPGVQLPDPQLKP